MSIGVRDLSGNNINNALAPKTTPRDVFTAETSSGDSSTIFWPGGIGEFAVEGTFDGCLVNLFMRNNSVDEWKPVGTHTQFTSAGVAGFSLSNCSLMARITSAGASTSIDAKINRGK